MAGININPSASITWHPIQCTCGDKLVCSLAEADLPLLQVEFIALKNFELGDKACEFRRAYMDSPIIGLFYWLADAGFIRAASYEEEANDTLHIKLTVSEDERMDRSVYIECTAFTIAHHVVH